VLAAIVVAVAIILVLIKLLDHYELRGEHPPISLELSGQEFKTKNGPVHSAEDTARAAFSAKAAAEAAGAVMPAVSWPPKSKLRKTDYTWRLFKPEGEQLKAIEFNFEASETIVIATSDTISVEEFVVVDLETTGLNAYKESIIEYGAVRIKVGDTRHDVFQQLVKPLRPLPPEIPRITGITQKILDEGGIDQREAFADFIKFVGNRPIVAYNADFDMSFLWRTGERLGRTVPNKYDCALKRFKRAYRGLPNYRLQTVSEVMRLQQSNGHRALDDAARACIVFGISCNKLKSKVRWTAPQNLHVQK
jgi:DNA polymerase III subunit epsilon